MLEKQDVSRIMGYGKIVQLLEGRYTEDNGEHKKGDVKIIDIHFTPLPLKDIPTLSEELDKFFSMSGNKGRGLNNEFVDQSSKIILMSTKKMHPDLTKDKVIELFGLEGLAEAVEVIIDINDFFTRMLGVMKRIAEKYKEVDEATKEIPEQMKKK